MKSFTALDIRLFVWKVRNTIKSLAPPPPPAIGMIMEND